MAYFFRIGLRRVWGHTFWPVQGLCWICSVNLCHIQHTNCTIWLIIKFQRIYVTEKYGNFCTITNNSCLSYASFLQISPVCTNIPTFILFSLIYRIIMHAMISNHLTQFNYSLLCFAQPLHNIHIDSIQLIQHRLHRNPTQISCKYFTWTT